VKRLRTHFRNALDATVLDQHGVALNKPSSLSTLFDKPGNHAAEKFVG
jgi:hypothetical protein